jgi:hypothetical protein
MSHCPAGVIDQRRQDYVQQVITALHTLILDLAKGDDWCDLTSSSMRLGALIRQMADRRLYSPRPEAPFLGYGVARLIESIESMETPEWYSRDPYPSENYQSGFSRWGEPLCGLGHENCAHSGEPICYRHPCGLDHDLTTITLELTRKIRTPKLEEFLVPK